MIGNFWISKMPSKLRKNTMPRRFAPRQFLTISQKVKIGGRGGIRTHDELAPIRLFESRAFNHSATLPNTFTILPKTVQTSQAFNSFMQPKNSFEDAPRIRGASSLSKHASTTPSPARKIFGVPRTGRTVSISPESVVI